MAVDGLSGGGRFDTVLSSMARRLGEPSETRVGFLEGSTESDLTSLPMVAAIQEFGAPAVGIPPRPYFRGMVKQHKGEWGGELGKVLPTVNYDAMKALSLMGEKIGDELRQSIIDLTDPPLSPVTVMLRQMRHQDTTLVVNRTVVAEARRRVAAGYSSAGASTKPLNDTGTMLGSVDHEETRA